MREQVFSSDDLRRSVFCFTYRADLSPQLLYFAAWIIVLAKREQTQANISLHTLILTIAVTNCFDLEHPSLFCNGIESMIQRLQQLEYLRRFTFRTPRGETNKIRKQNRS